MTDVSHTVVPLSKGDLRTAAGVMLRAYWDDPLMEYVLPAGRRSMCQSIWFMKVGMSYGLRYGVVNTTPDIAGVAVWLPPDHPDMELWGLFRTGLLFAPFRLGRKAFGRLHNVVEYTHETHRRLLSGEHWYLFELAVDPSRQRQNVGGSIIAPVLRRADEDGFPCYLETFTENAERFYLRHGFETVESGAPVRGGPFCRFMIRYPK